MACVDQIIRSEARPDRLQLVREFDAAWLWEFITNEVSEPDLFSGRFAEGFNDATYMRDGLSRGAEKRDQALPWILPNQPHSPILLNGLVNDSTKTLTTTSMAYRLGEIFNVPVYQTAVGFKYVAPLMMSQDAIIGGEESGGYGFRGHVAERDGILASLYFLDFMVQTGKSPSQLIDYLYSKVGPHHYKRVDITFPEAERKYIIDRVKKLPKTIDGVEVAKVDTTDGFRFILADNTWLLIRFSGTEPLLRIYTETDSPERADRLLKIGREIAGV